MGGYSVHKQFVYQQDKVLMASPEIFFRSALRSDLGKFEVNMRLYATHWAPVRVNNLFLTNKLR